MRSTVPALFAALVDDAGLFPPARLPMAAALARHREDLAGGHPVLTHRFLCPASRLNELRQHLADDKPLRIGLIGDTGIAELPAACATAASDARLRLEAVEVALPATDDAAHVRTHVASLTVLNAPVFVEIPRTPGWRVALDVVADAALGAKIRCGGLRVESFPTRGELAAFILAAVAADVRCKATAGLHHAVRYRDPLTDFEHHGFVNLLLAVCRAVEGAPAADVRAALALDDAETVAVAVRAVPAATAAQARGVLVAYGSCSTRDPIEDLVTLGLLGSDAW